MRERLHRLSRLSRDFNVVIPTNSSKKFPNDLLKCDSRRWPEVSRLWSVVMAVLLWPAIAYAQLSPWERAAANLEFTFTGPLARSLALVSIVIGGLMFMFGEGGAKRQISGIVFGGGLALFAAQFMTWLF
jgi:type IV secretory pathway VirB2 component (pilin)